MILLTDLDFSLPLKNPVIIFSLVLFIILFAPILLKKIKVPHIIGLILAGVIVGPYALNLLRRDSSIVLFGTVGLLYIMFLAGLEIDISEFKKNRKKIIFFGLITFTLPLICGTLASYYILGYGWLSSILLASMFSTHTLVSYPIASKYGVSRNRAVALAIGGTMITDILALLILAIIAGMTKGEVTSSFWITLGVSTVIFVGIVFFIFPVIIRWFFKHYEDSVSQYIFVLAIVFLSSFLAEAAGIEAIIGAFFAGLVLNNFIPHSSALMNRISFVGNALFIPFFLIGVGMLVNFNVLFNGWGALRVAGVIVVVAILTKFLAAWITQKSFRLFPEEGRMIFGLSTSHAAATLAIILVGYNIIIGETPDGDPIRLLDEDILNGTILLILVSCAISSFVVEKASHNIALKEAEEADEKEDNGEKILISLAYPDTVAELIDFGLMLKPKKATFQFML
jgi:Kef-type K+ transport system membrane component KefB